MLKNILEITGVNELKATDKKLIKGGWDQLHGPGPKGGLSCANGCDDPKLVCCTGICIRPEHAIAFPECN